MAPFYGWGSTASRLQPLRGGSLLFTTVGRSKYTWTELFLNSESDIVKAFQSLTC